MIDFNTAGPSGATRPTFTASDPSVAQTMMRSGNSKGLRRSRTLGSTRRAPAQAASTTATATRYSSRSNGRSTGIEYRPMGTKSMIEMSSATSAGQRRTD